MSTQISLVSLISDLPAAAAGATPDAEALKAGSVSCSYGELERGVQRFASSLLGFGLAAQERVALYADKSIELVTAMFGSCRAGGVMVPVNPLLKAEQVGYILRDCNVAVLVTTEQRLATLALVLPQCHDLRLVVVLASDAAERPLANGIMAQSYRSFTSGGEPRRPHRVIDADLAAILYTSGSTGQPKGVVLSHRNMLAGAQSVAQYLDNRPSDRILAVLPLSFDYGLSQLTTAFLSGATAVLHNYLLANDALRVLARERITGLAAVPPLWLQLAALPWPAGIDEHLRYFTNSGGAMPTATLTALRERVPAAKPFLMYGLTEAFRSTYLPPDEIDRRPTSIGKAIPNAEILVLREDGTPCADHEPGELVHRGALVSLGYWNDAARTAERFKPLPRRSPGIVPPELAVFSGDTVRRDEEGFLYFVGRRDEMIKSSGYRISPTEIEEAAYRTGQVAEVAAMGIEHPTLGQAVVLVALPAAGRGPDTDALLAACREFLPGFMMPTRIDWLDRELPRNANGKIDRKLLSTQRTAMFAKAS